VNCLNCGAALQGDFCHVCGQKASAHHLGLHDVAHEAAHELLHLDGKILTTMKLLLLEPGQLTKDFIEGKRVRYISPIRLYLTWSVIFFALAVIAPPRDRIVKINTSSTATAEDSKRAEKLGEEILHNLPRVMFVLMPVFALLTWLFYRRQQPYYVPHLYYAIHFHAFVFCILAAGVLLALAGRAGKVVGMTLFLAVFPYHFIGLKRVFGGSGIAWKGIAVGVLYWIAVIAVMMGMMMAMIRTI
jgi:hypothetical protein